MTWTREEGGTAGGDLLRRLHEAIGPFVVAAGRMESPSLVRVLAGGDVFVDVIWPDGAKYRGVGTGDVGAAISKAVGDLVVAGLNRRSVADRETLAPLVAQGALIVEYEPLFGSAAGSLEVPGNPPRALFSLVAGDVH